MDGFNKSSFTAVLLIKGNSGCGLSASCVSVFDQQSCPNLLPTSLSRGALLPRMACMQAIAGAIASPCQRKNLLFLWGALELELIISTFGFSILSN
jgi:hypothetical protein